MRLDLVIPAHNEQHRIDRTLRAYRAQIPPGTRVTVALDRCTDGTADAVRPHLADRRVRMFDFPKYGKGGVLMEAFRHLLVAVAAYGLAKDRSPSTLNNIAFAALHITVLLTGAWPALIGARREAAGPAGRLTALRADELRGPPIDVAR